MKSNDTFFRMAGISGLVFLLGFVLWAQQPSRSRHVSAHDHADPMAHGQSVAGTDLDQAKNGTLSGTVQGGVRGVEYDAFQYGFSPDPLVVQAGEPVQLLLKSLDVTHGILIPEVDVSASMPLDRRKPVAFTAPSTPGEYPVFCSVFCGPEHGNMKGRMVVLPAQSMPGDHHE